MRPAIHKDLRPTVKAAIDAGWTLDVTGSGHPRLTPPGGGPGITMSLTPRNPSRARWNLRRDLKQRGLTDI